MSIEVTTKDCAALGDVELAEMADLTATGVAWEVGQLGKQAEEWVLVSCATKGGKLQGFAFTTLERIGGTPAMVIGLAATARTKSNGSVLKALMQHQYHRALMAFPDEDVLVAGRLIDRGGLDLFERLADVRPADGVRANGEERAWGRRLSKRYGAVRFDDRTMIARGDGERLVIDHAPAGEIRSSESIDACDVEAGDYVIAWGWAMAEFLETFG
ncbi:MAG: hypothetical protein AAF547_14080 [Actinomycetota bacterium]